MTVVRQMQASIAQRTREPAPALAARLTPTPRACVNPPGYQRACGRERPEDAR
jgi:hypothetical protein